MKKLLVILANLALAIGQTTHPTVEEDLNQLGSALQQIKLEGQLFVIDDKPKKELSVTSGEWIVKNYPETLLWHGERTVDIEGKKTTVHVYQFKTLQQQSMECGFHQPRNTLYIMEMLNSSRSKFKQIYDKMVNKTSYEAYANATGIKRCTSASPETINGKIPKIIKACSKKNIQCLPTNSKDYLKQIVPFEYYNKNIDKLNPEAPSTQQTKILEKYKSAAKIADKTFTDTAGSDAIALSYPQALWINTFFAQQVEKLNQQNHHIFGINMDVFSTMDHAVSLVVHKQDNKVEYFFADPYNSSLKTGRWKNNYWAAIDKVITFLHNPQYFENALVCSWFIVSNNIIGTNFRDENLITQLEKLYLELKDHKVLDNKLYLASYKPAFCDLINEQQFTVSKKQGEEYKKLLEKVECAS